MLAKYLSPPWHTMEHADLHQRSGEVIADYRLGDALDVWLEEHALCGVAQGGPCPAHPTLAYESTTPPPRPSLPVPPLPPVTRATLQPHHPQQI